MDRNRKAEARMAEERRYSNKYGTINLTLLDNYKQSIKRNDRYIARDKAAYKKLTKKSFNPNNCKKLNYSGTVGSDNRDLIARIPIRDDVEESRKRRRRRTLWYIEEPMTRTTKRAL